MSVIPFPSRHWRHREPLSVRAAVAVIAGLCLMVWGAIAWAASLLIG